MKKFMLCCAMLLVAATTDAQMVLINDTFRFEQGLPAFFHIDTSQSNNTWQVGTPSKMFLNSAWSASKAMLTDTANPFPSGNMSSFTIHLTFDSIPWVAGMGMGSISFWHKYDFDSLHAGGTIDIRYFTNSWTPWVNIQLDPYPDWPAPNYSNDTIIGGVPGFRGRSNGWVNTGLFWFWCMAIKDNTAIVPKVVEIRFTAVSDSMAVPTDGWMIDDIEIYAREYWGSIEDPGPASFTSRAYPNPTSSDVCIQSGIGLAEPLSVMVFSATGRLCETIRVNDGEAVILQSNRYNPGIYNYKIITDSGRTSTGRFIRL